MNYETELMLEKLPKKMSRKLREESRDSAKHNLAYQIRGFKKNPSADNFQRLEKAMLLFQHYNKNVRIKEVK